MTKYGIAINNIDIQKDIKRLTNQLWKLIPMRENQENWQSQLDTLILEIVGLSEVLYKNEQFLVLLSKLEGLKQSEVEFKLYRKTVFETMSLLKEIVENDQL